MIDLARARKSTQKSQQVLADEVGISRGAYSNIENGNRAPSVAVAKKIAAVLGFDWTKFFDNGEMESRDDGSV